MGNFGVGEMVIIAIFGLLVFGPQRLPEIARSVGGFVREFKAVAGGLTAELKAEIDTPAKAASAKVAPAEGERIDKVTGASAVDQPSRSK